MKNIKLTTLALMLSFICIPVHAAQAVDEVNPITKEVMTSKPDAHNMKLTAHEDRIITKSITSHIHANKMLSKVKVDVKTTDGNVVVSGKVDSDSQASAVVEIAQSVVGVKDVDASKLEVKDGTQTYADTVITAKAKGLFLREKVFGKKDIAAINLSVETKEGVVYLTGTIDKNAQIENAIKIVQGIKGVKSVVYSVKKVEATN